MSKKQTGIHDVPDVADQAFRNQLDAFDQRIETRQAELANQQAQIRLEKQAAELQDYARQRIIAAQTLGKIAPSFIPILTAGTYSSYSAVDAAISAAIEGSQELAQVVAPVVTSPPRDETTGRFTPAPAPEQEQPQQIDLTNLTLAEYAEQVRGRLNMDKRGIENVGRAPGHERQSFMGHTLEEGSGFLDWRDSSPNERVFDSQLRDTRRRG